MPLSTSSFLQQNTLGILFVVVTFSVSLVLLAVMMMMHFMIRHWREMSPKADHAWESRFSREIYVSYSLSCIESDVFSFERPPLMNEGTGRDLVPHKLSNDEVQSVSAPE